TTSGRSGLPSHLRFGVWYRLACCRGVDSAQWYATLTYRKGKACTDWLPPRVNPGSSDITSH
ncbi:hypothetical protein CRG98_028129, partial [Punica granatum]